MSKVTFYYEYKLKKGASVEEFLAASEKLNNEYISKQKGYISWKQLNDNDIWVDLLTFETMDDVKAFEDKSNTNPNELALSFYSYINMLSCKVRYFSVEKSYGI
ncbi:MAG: hypothetical protein LBC96_10235 [Lachnospiraceae bacterium]|jgi:hypothetical protein|nr:hypothetical protein [Lachnospiraceae bacterium]